MNLTWPDTQPTVPGEHLTLRPWRDSDAQAVFEACQDEAIQRFTRVPEPYTMAEAEAFLAAAAQHWAERSEVCFAAVDPLDVPVAAITLMTIDDDQRTAEIGYWVVPWARGLGVARTAVVRICQWGVRELGIHRFLLRIEDENRSSVLAALAAGAVASERVEQVETKGRIRKLRHYWLDDSAIIPRTHS